MDLKVVEIDDPAARICSQDILFTGKEIFIGINNKTTNLNGACSIAKTFPEYSVQPIEMPQGANMPLKNYVSVGGKGFLLMSESNKHSKFIIEAICKNGKYLYEYLDVPDVKAINSIYINGTLLHLSKEIIGESHKVKLFLPLI